jgi:integrase
MHPHSPAAAAIIQALSDPGISDAQRVGLAQALQVVLAPTAAASAPATAARAPAAPAPQIAEPATGRARKRAAPNPERRAEAMLLTKESVAALVLPIRGERLVYDTVCPQLAVRLRPGSKSYLVSVWDKQRQRRAAPTLGATDKLTPEQARRQAQALVADVGNGIDIRKPAVDPLTLGELIDKWHAEKARNVRTADELRTKALHYMGKLAHRRAAEVTREDIGAIHSHIATVARKRVRRGEGEAAQFVETGPPGLPATADKWRAVLHSVFAWGVKKGLVANNPAAGIEAAFDAKGAQRSNYLRGDELVRFWKALEADPDADTRDAFLLLLHTAQRRGNVLEMKWAAVDLEAGLWTIAATDTKQRAVQTVTLTAQAREILARRFESASTQWVFAATRSTGPNRDEIGPMNETRMRDAWVRICAAAKITNLRVHDLRHTSASWLARLGSGTAVRQQALGHSTPAMAARYAHLENDQVADALQGMSNAIEAAATRPAAKVHRLHKPGK